MNILRKIQHQPEKTRKIIFWIVIIIFAFGLLFWWINNFQKRLADFQGEQFIEKLEVPEIKMPEFEVPKQEIEERIKKLEEIMQKAQE